MTTDIAPAQASAVEAFQNHESRLQGLEAVHDWLAQAFPQMRDALGLPRKPHQFSEDEAAGVMFDPNQGTIATLQAENAELNAKLDRILAALPALSSPSSGPILPPDPIIPQ